MMTALPVYSPTDRVPPHDLTAEQALIGSMLLGAHADVSPDDFYREAHGKMCEAINDLRAHGIEVDAVSLRDALPDDFPASYIFDVTDAVPTAANVKHYAEIVKRHAKSRTLIALGTLVVASGYDGSDPDEAIGEAMTALTNVSDTGHKRSVRLFDAVKKRLLDYREPTEMVMFPGTGARAHFGDVTIIGGDPGTGKTAFVLAALDVWRKRYKCLFLSYEMSADEISDRFITRAVKQPSEFAYDGLDEQELSVYERACSDLLDDRNLIIKEAAGMSEGQMVQTIRLAAAHGTRICAIDYAQIAHDDRGDNENASLSRFLRQVQRLAKSTGMAIVLLSQYNRSKEGGKPRMGNLRGSGSLEQEAANVLLMWSPDYDSQEEYKRKLRDLGYLLDPTGPENIVRIEWAKRRHGQKGSTDFYLFDGRTMSFEPIDREAR